MYQGIHFDYRESKAYVRDDNEGIVSFHYKPTYYRLDPRGKFRTLDGKTVSPTQQYDKYDTSLYEKDVDKNLSVLLDLYKEYDDVPEGHRKVFLDIETEIGGSINLPYCEKAPVKVTAIALYDSQCKQYYVWILDESKRIKESIKDDTIVIPCSTENELLSLFLDRWENIDPTILVTWNGDSFDVPYLYCRMKRRLGEKDANRLSPIGIVRKDDFDLKMPYKIALVNSIDYMRCYKKFIPKQQPSYALEAICMTELGKGKIKYEGSLDVLFKTDIDKFIEYNVNDVRLIVELDEKKKFLDLAIKVSHIGHVPYHYIYQSSKLLEGVIMTYLKRNNIVSPNKPTTNNPELKKSFLDDESEDDDKFAGAYVMDVIPGLYGWNFDLDLTSLYPSILLFTNASIETLLFKLIKDDPFDMSWTLEQMKQKDQSIKITIENVDGILKEMRLSKLVKFIEKNNIIITPNGTGFISDKTGMMCDVVQDWFNMRKHYKNLMKDAGKAGDTALYNFYDIIQSIYKILLNSIYGVMGLPSFRYSDGKDIIAESVTVTGRFVITTTGDWINEKINNEIDDS